MDPLIPRRPVKSILVVRLRAFGDTLLTTPTLRGLKKAYPNAKLSILLEPAMAQVVAGLPYIDEVIPYDRLGWKKQGKWAELKGTVGMWLALRRRRFDLVVDVLGTPRTAMMALDVRRAHPGGLRLPGAALGLQRGVAAVQAAQVHRRLHGRQPARPGPRARQPEAGFFRARRLPRREMDAWLAAQGLARRAPSPCW